MHFHSEDVERLEKLSTISSYRGGRNRIGRSLFGKNGHGTTVFVIVKPVTWTNIIWAVADKNFDMKQVQTLFDWFIALRSCDSE